MSERLTKRRTHTQTRRRERDSERGGVLGRGEDGSDGADRDGKADGTRSCRCRATGGSGDPSDGDYET